MSKVFLSGGTGYIGSHILIRLLEKGYTVRTSFRPGDEAHAEYFKSKLRGQKVTFHAADLRDPAPWADLVRGCDYVIHSASPFDMLMPTEEIVHIATEGVRNVFAAVVAEKTSVKKTVLTGSVVSIMLGHSKERQRQGPFTEADWSVEDELTGYWLSKPRAERIAHQIEAAEGIALDVILPATVFGPILAPHHAEGQSCAYIRDLLRNQYQFSIPCTMPLVDVRDVAELHVKALERPGGGERFILAADEHLKSSVTHIARDLYSHFNDCSQYRPPWYEVPARLLKQLTWAHKDLQAASIWIGSEAYVSNDKAKDCFSISFRDCDTTFQEQAISMMKIGGLPSLGYPRAQIEVYQTYPTSNIIKI